MTSMKNQHFLQQLLSFQMNQMRMHYLLEDKLHHLQYLLLFCYQLEYLHNVYKNCQRIIINCFFRASKQIFPVFESTSTIFRLQCEALIADPIAGNEIDGTIIVLRASISLNNFIIAKIASKNNMTL